MKFVLVAASALAFAATPALAGGWGGSHHSVSPQFAASSALNLAVQAASIKAGFTKGSITQVAGADAQSINKSSCGCRGSQTALATSKNVSLQAGSIRAFVNNGSISQTGVSTSLAKNVRSGGY